MKVGDLIIIVESLPDWSWLIYTTGHIGLVTKVIYEIFFFHNNQTHPVLRSFMKLLSELDEER